MPSASSGAALSAPIQRYQPPTLHCTANLDDDLANPRVLRRFSELAWRAGAAVANASKTQRRSAADGADARRLAAGRHRRPNRKRSLAALLRHPRSIRVHLRHLLLIGGRVRERGLASMREGVCWLLMRRVLLALARDTRLRQERGTTRHERRSDDDRLCAISLVAANGRAVISASRRTLGQIYQKQSAPPLQDKRLPSRALQSREISHSEHDTNRP